jgi:hypothetical protein
LGLTLLWRLQVDDEETRERREQIALRLVGASFLLLAAYVAYDSITSFIWRESPEPISSKTSNWRLGNSRKE